MSISSQPLKERARGRWRSILPALGISPTFLRNKHGPCPMCGGKDRFRYDDKEGKGTFYCSECGAGDGVRLVELYNGWDFKEAAAKIEDMLGETKYIAPKAEASDEMKRKAMIELWKQSRPVRHKDPVGLYLQERLGDIHMFPRCLRTVDDMRYHDDAMATFHPGMLALVRDPQGNAVNVHRTYLTKDGRKAPVEAPRRMMSGDIPKGSAVRLFPHYEDVLGIAEGIETAWSAHILFDVPVWSSINATMLSTWAPPKDVKKIMIFGDNDKSFTGHAVSYALAHRLKVKEGYDVEVLFPQKVGQDWNDVFFGEKHLHEFKRDAR